MEIEICWENFEIYIQKSQWKIDFLCFFYPIFLNHCHFKHLWKITPFSTTIFSVSGDIPPSPPPAGAPDFGIWEVLLLLNCVISMLTDNYVQGTHKTSADFVRLETVGRIQLQIKYIISSIRPDLYLTFHRITTFILAHYFFPNCFDLIKSGPV